jgi:glycosyltransferase involved in cell wall biosynthesis
MRVLLYSRKCRPNSNYSLESVFSDVAVRLASRFEIQQRTAPCYSNGILPRLRILRDIQKHQMPITHVTGDISFAVLGVRRDSAIVTIPDCGFVTNSKGMASRLKKWLWLTWPVRHAKRVTTISQSAKAEIVKYCPNAAEKTVVIPVAISESFSLRKDALWNHPPRILHVGTAPNKNLLRLIQALEGISCELTVIGVIRPRELDALHRYQINFRNRFGLNEQEVVEEYRRADLLAFVSTYEGFGMPILEAQATGIPVITSNVSSMPEVAGEGGALFVNPTEVSDIRNGILRLIHDPGLRSTLVESGVRNTTRFDPQAIAEKYFALYEETWLKTSVSSR